MLTSKTGLKKENATLPKLDGLLDSFPIYSINKRIK